MLPTIIFAGDYVGLKSILSQTLNARLEQYEAVSNEDLLDTAKGRSQIKGEIISIVESLSGKASSPVVDDILKEHSVDEVPQTLAIDVLSEIYTPNLENPQYTLNAKVEIALARLGHEKAFKNIVKGLDSENRNLRNQAFSKLARVRTEASLTILGEFLLGNHNKGFPAMASPGHAVGYASSEVLAMIVLSREFREIGPDLRKSTGDELKNWQEWWRQGYWKNELYSEDATSGVSVDPQGTLPNSLTKSAVSEGSEIFVETPEKPAEPSSNWWLWLIGAVVVGAGVGLVVRRK